MRRSVRAWVLFVFSLPLVLFLLVLFPGIDDPE
jgi:hypothetical protein